MMRFVGSIGTIALALATLSLALYFVESLLGMSEKVYTVGLLLPATAFFLYAVLSLTMFGLLLRTRSKLITSFYLVNNIVRIFLAAALIMVYGVLVGDGMLFFVINLFVYYILILVMVNRACLKADQIF